MKKILGLAAMAAMVLAAAPALAQRGGGGGHGGGGHAGGGGWHGGGGHVGGGWHGGGGYRGGYRGGYGGGYRYGGSGLYFGFGVPGYYPPYYGPMYSPYYYGYPYPPAYGPNYSYSEDLGDDSDQGDRGDGDWRVTRRDGETDFELPDNVLFGLDSAKISPDADAVLKEIADAAKEKPDAHLVIEGHTDTSGTAEHNQQLSDARARAVAAVLARAGVERDRITTEGLGESQLAVQTGDEVREPRNRRVVVRLIEAVRSPQARDEPPRSGNRP